MKGKLFAIFIGLLLVCGTCFLAACNGISGISGISGTDGTDGINGLTPYIGENGNWWIGDIDTEVKAEGENGVDGIDGLTPYVGENGNWWIGDIDTEVKAEGENGEDSIACAHQYGDWFVCIEPACESMGYNKRICSDCQKEEYDFQQAVGHTYSNFNPLFSTEEESVLYRTCRTCGDTVLNVERYSKGLAYTLSNDGTYYMVSGIGTCEDANIVIPPKYKNVPVTVIQRDAFFGCDNVTKVVIPNGVTRIEDSAFYGCRSLTCVTIPQSVTVIGNGAFANCPLAVVYMNSEIETDEISASVVIDANGNITYNNDADYEYIFTDDGYLFRYRTKAQAYYLIAYAGGEETITLPKDINGNSYKIDNMIGVVNVIIPSTTTVIDDCAFVECLSLKNITLSNNVTSIGWMAFAFCDSLKSINIPDSVTNIDDYAFEGCINLKNVIIGKGLKTIGERPFFSCYSLTDIEIDKNNPYFTSIDGNLYTKDEKTLIRYAIGKTSTVFDIPDSVTTITPYAFYECEALESITIPSDVTRIGDYAFYFCNNLLNISVADDNAVYQSIDGNLYSKHGKTLIQYATGKTATSFTVPNDITAIGSAAFCNCVHLQHIVLPTMLTRIGSMAFMNCEDLKSIQIPEGVTIINDDTFHGCINLTSIAMTGNVTSIGFQAFCNCESLTDINIPNSVTNIGKSAFLHCKSLTSIHIPDGVTTIYYQMFAGCESLIDVTIPSSVANIGRSAFYGCENLRKIIIPSSVTSIEEYAFIYCDNLTIYAEVANKPEGWHFDWNESDCVVVWGYTK